MSKVNNCAMLNPEGDCVFSESGRPAPCPEDPEKCPNYIKSMGKIAIEEGSHIPGDHKKRIKAILSEALEQGSVMFKFTGENNKELNKAYKRVASTLTMLLVMHGEGKFDDQDFLRMAFTVGFACAKEEL